MLNCLPRLLYHSQSFLLQYFLWFRLQPVSGAFGSITIGNSLACVVQTWVDTQVTCRFPPGSGSNLNVVLTTATINYGTTPFRSVTKLAAFSYSAPSITALSPTNGPTSGFDLTISGSSFDTSGSVTLSGTGNGNAVLTCGSPVWTHTQIVCRVPASVGTAFTATVTAASGSYSLLLVFLNVKYHCSR